MIMRHGRESKENSQDDLTIWNTLLWERSRVE